MSTETTLAERDAVGVDGRCRVDLLTGFLGSGKTSLLNRLLRDPRLARTAVLVNELGEIGLDHLLIETVDDEVVLLQSGCVCCSIRGDLKEALLRLWERRRLGEVPPFERIVIETTGLADPAPIVATFSADPMLVNQMRLGNVVTVVDAVSGADNLARFEESLHQVAVADRIVVSKTDLVDEDRIAALEAELHRINPTAAISRVTADSPVPAALVLESVQDEATRAAEVGRWLAAADSAHRHHAHAEVRTLVLTREEPLDWAAFGLWFGMLLNRHGRAVLRTKGILRLVGEPRPVVVHGVQHTIHPPLHLESWPEGRPETRLVLILAGLDPALVERSFRAFMAAA